jgi:hypothetical protein
VKSAEGKMISKDDLERRVTHKNVFAIDVPENAAKRIEISRMREKVCVLNEERERVAKSISKKSSARKISVALGAFPSMQNNLDCKFIHEKN